MGRLTGHVRHLSHGRAGAPVVKESPLRAHRPLERVVVRAPAKLNLHLTVGRRRRDGFHDLTTVYLAVSAYDELTITRSGDGPGSGDELTITGDGAADVPTDDTNLAVRAVRLIAAHTGHSPQVGLALHKGIAVAGGCAGGSADAAAALVGCNALWGADLPREELDALAAELGSDVPFSLHGGIALGTGRGERLTTVLGRGAYAFVLAVAAGGLSTPAVYAELDRQREHGPVGVVGEPSQVLAAVRRGDPVALGRAMTNDLQPAALALRPALRRLVDTGLELGALGALVSGSGPTVALLARDRDHATRLAASLAGYGLARSLRCVDGPVPGARVVA